MRMGGILGFAGGRRRGLGVGIAWVMGTHREDR